MFNFKKNSADTSKKDNDINSIDTIDLNRVISICFTYDDLLFSSRFFIGKKHASRNAEVVIGIKGQFAIPKNSSIVLTYNMISGERYSQPGLVTSIDKQLITVELDSTIKKIEERRKNIKVDCELTGEITVINKKIYVDINNICVGGIFIKTDIDLPLKSIHMIHINELELTAKIEIIRQQKNRMGCIEGYGCIFKDINDKNEQKIIQHINLYLLKQRQTLVTRDVYNYKTNL